MTDPFIELRMLVGCSVNGQVGTECLEEDDIERPGEDEESAKEERRGYSDPRVLPSRRSRGSLRA